VSIYGAGELLTPTPPSSNDGSIFYSPLPSLTASDRRLKYIHKRSSECPRTNGESARPPCPGETTGDFVTLETKAYDNVGSLTPYLYEYTANCAWPEHLFTLRFTHGSSAEDLVTVPVVYELPSGSPCSYWTIEWN
jgi:hypothetical protein